jgi:hypothetical protein
VALHLPSSIAVGRQPCQQCSVLPQQWQRGNDELSASDAATSACDKRTGENVSRAGANPWLTTDHPMAVAQQLAREGVTDRCEVVSAETSEVVEVWAREPGSNRALSGGA